MLTVVCEAPGKLRAEERAVPVPAEGEVLLRVRRVGVCGTDLHIFAGRQPYLSYPRAMGHEVSATVAEAPGGGRLAAGDAVYVKAEGITLDPAAMVEFLAIGARAVRRAQVQAGQRVLVIGAGPIGTGALPFARLRGATVVALASRADRLAFCAERLGAAACVPQGEHDAEALAALSAGEFFDVVFDATGNAAAMERGLRFVVHAGTYVLISVVQADIRFSDPEFHKRETTLLASRNATANDLATVLQAMREGRVPQGLDTHRMALAEVPARFPGLLDPAAGVVKAIVEC
ncbi:MAG: zinc-binding dehydrogenase [Rubrivivax sp.]|nr:zinc-binding dehydrogenase [Rubrivivax sp.]